jgi:hypothetical protein
MKFGKKTIASFAVLFAAVLWRSLGITSKVKSPIVEISSGKLQGVVAVSRDGRQFYEYLGIPYAKPPIAGLRFEVNNQYLLLRFNDFEILMKDNIFFRGVLFNFMACESYFGVVHRECNEFFIMIEATRTSREMDGSEGRFCLRSQM